MRLMLFGSRLESLQDWQPTAHGNNFWLDLIPELREKVEQVTIVCIAGTSSRTVSPVPIASALPFQIRHDKLEPNWLIKTILFAGVYPWLQGIVKKLGVDVLHFIDNYGPIQVALSGVKTVKTISLTHYDPIYPIYDVLLATSLRPFDAVAVGSRSLAQKTRELYTSPGNITTIPWAVSPDHLRECIVSAAETRARFGLKSDSKVVLWSGFISTVVGMREFLFSHRVAKQLLHDAPSIEFVFAFKRRHFRSEYRKFEQGGIRIIPTNSRTDFLKLAQISSLLFSPCLNNRAIIGPPLTWLECMAYGVPIVTTNVRGVDEIIDGGKNGIILSDPEKAPQVLFELLGDSGKTKQLAISARETVKRRYGIDKAAASYMSLWSSLTRR